ncbi:MAG: Ig-like domain-containing protein [Candidatus Phlomobacter fragariae]
MQKKNIDVIFIVRAGANIETVKGKTDTDGKAITKVTSKKAGTYTVKAKVNDKETSKQTTFVADSRSEALAEV